MEVLVRQAETGDIPQIDALMARAFPRLLKADYPPSTLVLAVPRMAKAQPRLIASGTYFVAQDPSGRLLGSGGWTASPPHGQGDPQAAHVRHFATDPDCARQGVGRAILSHALADATMRGMQRMDCFSTRTAEKFYAAMGFRRMREEEVEIQLKDAVVFPAIAMSRTLA